MCNSFLGGMLIERSYMGRCSREKTHGNQLRPDQSAHEQQIAVPWHAQQERDWIADVPDDQLDGEVRLDDAEVLAPPAEQAVDEAQQGEDAQQRGDDHARDLQAQPSAVGEGVQRVGRPVLLVVRDDDPARRQRLLGLRVAQLRDGQAGRDAHDAARDERLRVQAEADVGHQHGAGDGGEAGRHDLVQLGLGQVRDEGPDQHRRLALPDEGRGGRHDGLGARDAHRPEEEDGEFADEPLQDAPVVEQLDERDEAWMTLVGSGTGQREDAKAYKMMAGMTLTMNQCVPGT